MRLRFAAGLACLVAAFALPPGAAAQTKPVVVGAAIAETGFLADLAAGTRNALLLWQAQVNAADGLLGRPVDLKLYDDASDSLRETALYEKLIKEDHADLLIGAFGSAATSMSAAVAERSRRVMVNATGASPEIHRRLYRYVFQVPPPSDATAAGIMAVAAKAGLKSLVVTARQEDVAAPLLEQLRRRAGGMEVRPAVAFLRDPMLGLGPFAKKLAGTQPDVIVSPAGPHDSADLVRGLKAAGYAPKLLVTAGVLSPDFIRLIGQDAEYAAAFSSYETRAATPGNAEFVKAYRAKYNTAPDFHAACGWSAGMVIEAAVAKAGSLEQEKLRVAFATLETPTVLGGYKVAADGSQLAATAFLVQILRGRREVVWPDAFRSAEPVVPMPEWSRRKPL